MKTAIIQQRTKDAPGGSFVLTTSLVDGETGEIITQEVVARLSFAWDSVIESALDEAWKHAESAGVKDIRIDSPFYEAIQARKGLLAEMKED